MTTDVAAFEVAKKVTDAIKPLMEGADFAATFDDAKNQICFEAELVVHIGEETHHVTSGASLVYSTTNPRLAVIEAFSLLVQERTRKLLCSELLQKEL